MKAGASTARNRALRIRMAMKTTWSRMQGMSLDAGLTRRERGRSLGLEFSDAIDRRRWVGGRWWAAPSARPRRLPFPPFRRGGQGGCIALAVITKPPRNLERRIVYGAEISRRECCAKFPPLWKGGPGGVHSGGRHYKTVCATENAEKSAPKFANLARIPPAPPFASTKTRVRAPAEHALPAG